MPEAQFADPAVSRRKFNSEIDQFRAQAAVYRRRGWYLAHAKFPEAVVVLATAKTQPVTLLCGVAFDYTNYDAAPPSVRLVHPLTFEPYKGSELPTTLPRLLPAANAADIAQAPPAAPAQVQAQFKAAQPLMQAHDEELPFLCIAGVREYHDHPAHSGDDWELHRPTGAGRLIRLVEIISKYGPETIVGFHVHMIPKVEYRLAVPPE